MSKEARVSKSTSLLISNHSHWKTSELKFVVIKKITLTEIAQCKIVVESKLLKQTNKFSRWSSTAI